MCDLGPEGVAHLGALEALALVVQEGRRLGRGHQALFHQRVQRPAHHQLHLQGCKGGEKGSSVSITELCYMWLLGLWCVQHGIKRVSN